MKQVLYSINKKGSKNIREPRLFGDIMKEWLRSNSPIAEDYRKYLASKEAEAEKGGLKDE